ncbi:hypothetical protein BC833DRAFT_645389 [Globomyces pollinis-pini]|nr:hypothetical protein BC833DRAFT_645389 [Globomyces pollinis-pini]
MMFIGLWTAALLQLCNCQSNSGLVPNKLKIDGYATTDGQVVISIQSSAKGWVSIGAGATMSDATYYLVGYTSAAGSVVATDNIGAKTYAPPTYNPKQTSKLLTTFDGTKESWANIAFTISRPADTVDWKIGKDSVSNLIYAFGDELLTGADPASVKVNKHQPGNKGTLSVVLSKLKDAPAPANAPPVGSALIANKLKIDGYAAADGQIVVNVQCAAKGWVSIGAGLAVGIPGKLTMSEATYYLTGYKNAAGSVVATDNIGAKSYAPPTYNPKQTSKLLTELDVPKEPWANIAFTITRPADSPDWKIIKDTLGSFIYAYGDEPLNGEPSSVRVTKHLPANKGRLSLDFTKPKPSFKSTGSDSGKNNTQTVSVDSAGSIFYTEDYQTVVILHAYVMIFAWLLCPFIGIFIARYLKDELGIWWLRLHGLFMVVGVGIGSLTGIAFIFLYKSAPHFETATSLHPILGLVVTILLLIQIVLGIVCDKLFIETRTSTPWWDQVHWWLGRAVTLFAIVNIVLGILLYQKNYNQYPLAVISGSGIILLGGIVAMVYGQLTIGQVHHVKEDQATKVYK